MKKFQIKNLKCIFEQESENEYRIRGPIREELSEVDVTDTDVFGRL